MEITNETLQKTLNEEQITSLHDELGLNEPQLDMEEYQEFLKQKKQQTRVSVDSNNLGLGMDIKEMPQSIVEPAKEKLDIEVSNEIPEYKSDSDKYVKVAQERPTTSPKKNATAFLNNLSIDVNSIEIIDAPQGLSKIDDYDLVINNRPTYQVVCNQSCYVAQMEALKYADSMAITNSSLDAYASRVKLYQTIYAKTNATSLGKISYKDFLRITSFYDISSLIYGIYQQSFPGETEFTINCGHCSKPVDVKINNDTLVSAKDESVYKNIMDVINSVNNPEEALGKSIVNKTTRKVLPDTKIIVDIQTPSLHDHLTILGSVDKNKIDENADLIAIMLFLKKILMLDVKASMESGTAKYYEIKNNSEIAKLIRDLPLEDFKILSEEMQKRIDQYAINYKISSFPCPHCAKDLGDIPIDMEQLLFHRILQ